MKKLLLLLALLLLVDGGNLKIMHLLKLIYLVIKLRKVPRHSRRGSAKSRYRRNVPRDLYMEMCQRPHLFKLLSNFNRQEFDDLHDELQAAISAPRNIYAHFSEREQIMRRRRACSMSTQNRLLLILINLAGGNKYKDVSSRFNISIAVNHLDFYHIVPIIMEKISYEIQWPNVVERQMIQGTLPEFPDVIGILDATSGRIRRPTQQQQHYFRGDKPYHAIIHQIITDPTGCVIDVDGGVPGRQNDLSVYDMSSIGVHPENRLQPDEILMADGGYPGRGELLIPPNQHEIKEDPSLAMVHRSFQRRRAVVEHVFGRIKMLWNIVQHRYNYKKEFYFIVFRTCCLLTNRIMRLRGYPRDVIND